MTDVVITPLLLGLSTGAYCVVSCVPFIAPVMISDAHSGRENARILAKFILGRLAGYLVFGALSGYLGSKLSGVNWEWVSAVALIVLSLVLILHALGLMGATRLHTCALIRKFDPDLPFFMGVLMGVNACPPFLLSLTYVLTLQSALKGIVYFFLFFIGTSVYFIPLFFLGYLSKLKEFQFVGRVSAVIVGLLFLGYGVYHLIVIRNS
jgi:sulfite exporter TauE/SafE